MKYYYITPIDKEGLDYWYPLHKKGDNDDKIYYHVKGDWLHIRSKPSIYDLYHDVIIKEITKKELNKYLLVEKLGK
jgi:hypothetical protein